MQQMVGSTLDHMRGLSDGGEELCADRPQCADLEPEAGRGGGRPCRHRCRQTPRPVMGRRAGAQALPAESARQCAGIWPARRHHGPGRRRDGERCHLPTAVREFPESDIERVFEPFYRVEGSRNRNSGGSGLGLSIARNIAQAHGGAVRLRNLPRAGWRRRCGFREAPSYPSRPLSTSLSLRFRWIAQRVR